MESESTWPAGFISLHYAARNDGRARAFKLAVLVQREVSWVHGLTSQYIHSSSHARHTDSRFQHRDYDEHGPVGPTAFWKINDSVEKDL